MNSCIKKIALLVLAALCQMNTVAMAQSERKNTEEAKTIDYGDNDHGGTGGCGSGIVLNQ